jgi:hypothetical protein
VARRATHKHEQSEQCHTERSVAASSQVFTLFAKQKQKHLVMKHAHQFGIAQMHEHDDQYKRKYPQPAIRLNKALHAPCHRPITWHICDCVDNPPIAGAGCWAYPGSRPGNPGREGAGTIPLAAGMTRACPCPFPTWAAGPDTG